ncbi:TIR domain-containing protein [Flavitalea flava]
MGKEKNVFISHYNKDDEHIQNLKDLLAKKGYTLKNGSIDSTKPNRVVSAEAIKRLLRLRINWAGTFICLIGKDTHTRPWVNWEIEQAKIKGKFIIGVKVFGEGDATVPESFEKYGDCLTGWNSDKIIDALEGNDIGWSDSNSATNASSYSVITVSCK